MIDLEQIKTSDRALRAAMSQHYSKPKGFIGRVLAYRITYSGDFFGFIVGASACLHLPDREAFFGLVDIDSIVNNVFFSVEKDGGGKYPCRNFTTAVVGCWRRQVTIDWRRQYGSLVEGFETLVEPPRTGELYRRDGWYRNPRMTGGKQKKWPAGYDNPIWITDDLRPKIVFYRNVEPAFEKQ